MPTVADIRFIIEREVADELDNESVIIWCNNANSDFGVRLNIPDSGQIELNTTDMKYALPEDLKQINYMYLQSDYDNGINRPFKWPYRHYNGYLWFNIPYRSNDTLNIDYFRNPTYFTTIEDELDIADRFTPIYTFYGKMQYYKRPAVMNRLGETQARQESELAQMLYLQMKDEVISYYEMRNQAYVVKERW